jgi:hypothetical protein
MHNGKIKKALIATFSILGILYIAWNGRNVLLGPRIEVLFPQNGETLEEPLLSINGKAANASFLTLNDKQIFVDNAGYFSERIALLPGINTIKIGSKDRFGETEEKILHVYFKGEAVQYNDL